MKVFRPQGGLRASWVCQSCRARTAEVTGGSVQLIKRHTSTTTTSSRKAKLPNAPVRTRFAPSPTGNIHLGSIRTALFNYLIARRTGGQFLLRVEDTDQKRTVPGAEERLFEDLRWAGLHWDEGPSVGGPHGPYRQSERVDVYHKHIQPLLENGTAYRCFCSAERLDGLNRLRHDKGLPLGYDRRCADIEKSESDDRAHRDQTHVIRFRAPDEYPKFIDLVYGRTGHGSERAKKFQREDAVYDDPILMKSDGYPTYHFANVVDDQLMKITHVIRGSEWMASTPLHVALYAAFGWTPPAFGHVPLLVDHNKQKLSKRNFDSDMASFRNAGYLPGAITNFAALLGWSHQQKSDVMTLKQLETIFDLKFTKGNTIVAFDKLTYLQEQHARKQVLLGGEPFEQLIRDIAVILLEQHGATRLFQLVGKRKLRDVIAQMLQVESLPYRSPSDFAQRCSIFLTEIKHRPALEAQDPSLFKTLRTVATTLCLTPTEYWTKEVHRTNMAMLKMLPESDNIAAERKIKKELYHYLRWALLGGMAGPSLPETMEILGKDICTTRVMEASLVTKETENMMTKPQIERLARQSSPLS